MVKEQIVSRRFVKNQLFGLDSLSEKFEDNILIITEGMTDAISVIQTGYYCLSPITIRFRREDFLPIVRYAKRYEKVIVINDNEPPKEEKEYSEGLLGSIETAKLLYEQGIANVYIGVLPDQYKDAEGKVDINSFLSNFATVDKQHEELKKVIDSAKQVITFLLSEADCKYKKFTDEQFQEKANFKEKFLSDLLEIIPEKDIAMLGMVKGKFRSDFELNPKDYNILSNQIRAKFKIERVKKEKKKKKETDTEGKVSDNVEYWYDNRYKILEADDGIWACEMGEGSNGEQYPKRTEQILYGGLVLISKTFDHKTDNEIQYSYYHNGVYRNTYTLDKMILKFKKDLYKGTFGHNVIANYIREKGKKLDFFEAEYVMGFSDGWKLPQTEVEGKFSLITQTGYHRKLYMEARNMIKKYTDEEKKKIKKLMKELVDVTQVDRTLLAIIIGWAMAAPFREEFIDYFKVFPLLLLTGKLGAGKSYLEDLFIVDFYGIWEQHFSPSEIRSESRIEDKLSSSTFPIDVQEVHKFPEHIIGIFKDQATSRSNFERKNATQDLQACKPKVAPIAMDANDVPDGLNSPALNSKMIHLQLNKSLESDEKWNKLFSQLRRKKLFSLVYDYTKDWDRKSVRDLLKKLKKQFVSKTDNQDFKRYSRLIEAYVAVMFGLNIFHKVFGYNFPFKGNEILQVLAHERREAQKSYHDQFYEFCKEAMNYDYGFEDEKGYAHKGNNPSYLNHPLEKNNAGFFIFTNNNKTDFLRRIGENDKMGMEKLASLIQESLDNKELLVCARHSLLGKTLYGLKIDPAFFEDEKTI